MRVGIFFVKPLCLSASSYLGRNLPWFTSFSGCHNSPHVHPSPYRCCKWTYPMFTMPPMQHMRHFHWQTTCFPFTLGNKCISEYAINTTLAEFPQGHLNPVNLTKLGLIMFCHLRKLHSKVKLATIVEGDLKAPFSIATTPRCRGGRYSFPRIDPLYPWSVPYNVEC